MREPTTGHTAARSRSRLSPEGGPHRAGHDGRVPLRTVRGRQVTVRSYRQLHGGGRPRHRRLLREPHRANTGQRGHAGRRCRVVGSGNGSFGQHGRGHRDHVLRGVDRRLFGRLQRLLRGGIQRGHRVLRRLHACHRPHFQHPGARGRLGCGRCALCVVAAGWLWPSSVVAQSRRDLSEVYQELAMATSRLSARTAVSESTSAMVQLSKGILDAEQSIAHSAWRPDSLAGPHKARMYLLEGARRTSELIGAFGRMPHHANGPLHADAVQLEAAFSRSLEACAACLVGEPLPESDAAESATIEFATAARSVFAEKAAMGADTSTLRRGRDLSRGARRRSRGAPPHARGAAAFVGSGNGVTDAAQSGRELLGRGSRQAKQCWGPNWPSVRSPRSSVSRSPIRGGAWQECACRYGR
jgi:hypothetical protein